MPRKIFFHPKVTKFPVPGALINGDETLDSAVDIFSDSVCSTKAKVVQDGHHVPFDKRFEVKQFIYLITFCKYHDSNALDVIDFLSDAST